MTARDCQDCGQCETCVEISAAHFEAESVARDAEYGNSPPMRTVPTVPCPSGLHYVAATQAADGSWWVPAYCPACKQDTPPHMLSHESVEVKL